MDFRVKKIEIVTIILILTGLLHSKLNAQAPIASFNSTTPNGCAPLTLTFTNTSVSSNSWHWNFGNGNTSTLKNPTAVYVNSGLYTVTLVAINTLTGLRDTFTQVNYVNVAAVPNPMFTVSPSVACSNNALISFTNVSSGATAYTWDFGDGTSSNAVIPIHNYSSAGNYTVKLIAKNSANCSSIYILNNAVNINPKPQAQFTVNTTSTCDSNFVFSFNCTTPSISSCLWDFGDGTTSSSLSPNKSYGSTGTFTVSLIVIDANGCSDTLVKTAFINIGPTLIPSITVSDTSGCAPLFVNFQCTVPNAVSWSWDFGNGFVSNQQNPSQLFAQAGSFTVSLNVTTTSGCNGTVVFPSLIKTDTMPFVDFTMVEDTGCKPFNVQFVNLSAGGSVFDWNLGDGNFSTILNPNHTYSNAGSYNVTLKVTTPNLCSATKIKYNAVVVQSTKAAFVSTPTTGCNPLNVTFTPTFTTGISQYFWQFGNGNTSNAMNPSTVYLNPGLYSPTLIVTNNKGCIDTLTRNDYINVVPGSISYTVPDTIFRCQPASVSFVDPTAGSSAWLWDFGDGNTSALQNPVHTYSSAGIYTATLQVQMNGGCSQTFNPYAIIKVYTDSVYPIVVNGISNCKPYNLSVSNSTPGASSIVWDFGDGTTASGTSANHTYTTPGVYNLTCIVSLPSGCSSELIQSISIGHVNPISASTYTVCNLQTVNFSLTSNPFSSLYWDFGDGTSSSLASPTHSYSNSGNYQVTLYTTDAFGCLDTFLLDSVIKAGNPQASFVINGSTSGCNNLSVSFQNTSTNASTYQWDFGNGINSSAQNPTYNYSTSGVYFVSLTVSSNGCTSSYTAATPIIVNTPLCNFFYTYGGNCMPITVNYTDLSSNATAWFWEFGDGATSTLKNPTHTFSTPPTAPVKLSIVDTFGCTNSRAKPNINYFKPGFTALNTSGCNPLTVSFSDTSAGAVAWFWDFGDGSTSSQQNPTHVYNNDGNYTITLIATAPSGCQDTVLVSNLVTVVSPVADFSASTTAGCSPTQVSFVNQSSNAVSYSWQFGNGSSSQVLNPTHIYNIPGTYDVTLVAMDASGCTDTLVQANFLTIQGTFAQFNVSDTMGCQNLMVQFSDLSVNAFTWQWDFGDGNLSNQQNPTHFYADTGSYSVTLITTDTIGCTSFYTYPVNINIYANPVIDVSSPFVPSCQPIVASFTNNSNGANTYSWDFGDGTTSSALSPTHTYLNSGSFIVQLIAYSTQGCTDTFSFPSPFIVHATPIAAYTIISPLCSDRDLIINNTSSNLFNPVFNWDFGDGTTTSTFNPIHNYVDTGTYSLEFVITNSFGCADTLNQTIVINLSPTAIASTLDSIGCEDYSVQFVNYSLNADYYHWDFGDGTIDSSFAASNTYLDPGIYSPMLIVSTLQGCTDTAFISNQIEVLQTPVADFTVNNNVGCPGEQFSFTNLSLGLLPGASFSWYHNNQFFSSQASPSLFMFDPGFHDFTLVATNPNGCFDSILNNAIVKILDTIPPDPVVIERVTVMSDESVKISWQNSSANDLMAYYVFRLNNQTNDYDTVYVESNPQNAGMSINSEYTDTLLNTLSNIYTYKVLATDVCQNAVGIERLVPHSTINIEAQTAGNNIYVSWTPYDGCSVNGYILERTHLASNTTVVVANLDSTGRDFLDQGFACPEWYSYRVTAFDLCGNTYTSQSDTAVAAPRNLYEEQKVTVVKSTVINNQDIYTEWLPPVYYPDSVLSYEVYRSVDHINYQLIAIVPAGMTYYIDNSVGVDVNSYHYVIEVRNTCDLLGLSSNKGTSILLEADKISQYKTKFRWTPYQGWDAGVNSYVIEKLDPTGKWVPMKVVSGNMLSTDIPE